MGCRRNGRGVADGGHDRLLDALEIRRCSAVNRPDAMAAGHKEIGRRFVSGRTLFHGACARASLRVFNIAQGVVGVV